MSDDRSQPLGELKPEQASVVYDGKTGKIVLVHQVATAAGATRRSPTEVDREALKLASTMGIGGALKALSVASAALAPGETYKVDLKRGTLVPTKRAVHKRKSARSSKRKRY
jgi:hypothetical protein